jgi:hypothetical protein
MGSEQRGACCSCPTVAVRASASSASSACAPSCRVWLQRRSCPFGRRELGRGARYCSRRSYQRRGRTASARLDRTSHRRQLDGPAQFRWGRRRSRAVPARSVTWLQLRRRRGERRDLRAVRPPGHLRRQATLSGPPAGASELSLEPGRLRPADAVWAVVQLSPVGGACLAVEAGCAAGMASAPPAVSGSIVWASWPPPICTRRGLAASATGIVSVSTPCS